MLSGKDLREYRLLSNISQRDVARYCDVSHELIGKVERGELNVTEYNHAEITKGINRARQAIANGTFVIEKENNKVKTRKNKEEKEK